MNSTVLSLEYNEEPEPGTETCYRNVHEVGAHFSACKISKSDDILTCGALSYMSEP